MAHDTMRGDRTARDATIPSVIDRGFVPAVMAIWVLGTVAVLAMSLASTDGTLVLSIDDPMIHLALAEQLAQGHHGVNAGEVSAPSSSMLWPWLLVLPELWGMQAWGPWLLAVIAQGAAVWLLAVQVRESIATTWLRWTVAVIGLGLVNAFGLPMTGMEHSLHVLAAMATVRGLVLLDRGQEVGWWLDLAIVVQGLVRYEGLAFSGLAILWLAHRSHTARAGRVAIALALPVVAHVTWMASLGLPLVPSSVLLKSAQLQGAATGPGALVASMVDNLGEGARAVTGIGLLAAVAVLVVEARARGEDDEPSRSLLVVLVLALVAHVLFGAYDWFSRYEVYAMGIAVMAMLAVVGGRLDRVRTARQVIAVQLLMVLAAPFALDTFMTPAGARNMHEQQFQMHKIAVALDEAVAVNDLGHVSHDNGNYVLDLWGLASEEVRRAQLGGGLTPALADDLVRRHDVPMVMAYDGWVPDVPGWTRVATLTTSRVTAGEATVEFHATTDDAIPVVVAAIESVEGSLPPGATLSWDDLPG